ncbi:MAG: N-acetyl-gamma-glutamyl-phosphate reductase [Planctomycetota bacterium]
MIQNHLSSPSGAPRAATRRHTSHATVGLYGASGTTGVELARLLTLHPEVEIAFATSRSERGRTLDEIDPSAPCVELSHPDDVDAGSVDIVLLAVPHGTAGVLAEQCLATGSRVIDVSGDHRLIEARNHDEVYGTPRSHDLAREAAYGLPELGREAIRAARLVANPGCYATASILPLAPLATAGFLDDLVVIDAKSGVSGAGRTPTATTHFCSAANDVQPYKVGRVHRHVAEIEQALRLHDVEQAEHQVVFNPHLVPIERGIQATAVVRTGDAALVRATLEDAYRGEEFVRVLPAGRCARIRGVAYTNRAEIAVTAVPGVEATVVTVAIDNLLKGAAGQAVQNLNLMAGFPENTGLLR